MISSRDLYQGQFNGKILENKLLKSDHNNVIAENLNFINLGKFEIENLCSTLIYPLTGEAKFNKQVSKALLDRYYFMVSAPYRINYHG
jgi:hypothetical protein